MYALRGDYREEYLFVLLLRALAELCAAAASATPKWPGAPPPLPGSPTAAARLRPPASVPEDMPARLPVYEEHIASSA
jgi:hypothetical protein